MFGKKKPAPQKSRYGSTRYSGTSSTSTTRIGGYTFDDPMLDAAIIDTVSETFDNDNDNDSYDSSSDSSSDSGSSD